MMKHSFLLFIGLIICGFTSAQSEEEKFVEVRDKLLYAIDYQGNNTNKPEVILSDYNKKIASTNANEIFIDQKAYKLLESAGVLDEGLALLIGHELGHVSRSSLHYTTFSVVPVDVKQYKKNPCDEKKCKEMEQFCDYFGCFAAYRAGYDIWAKAPQIFNALCADYDCKANELYKSKEERTRALEALEDSVKEMSDRFDTANALTLIGEFAEAHAYYQSIYEVFPSREIGNNIALTYLLESMLKFPDPVSCFVYPFELDHQTRLREGVRGDDEKAEKEAAYLVGQAIDILNEITGQYDDYTPALFNLGCAYLLDKQYDKAIRHFDTCVLKGNKDIEEKAALGKAIAVYFDEQDRTDLEKLKDTSTPNIREMATLNLQKIANGNCNEGNKNNSQNCSELSEFPPNIDLKAIESQTNKAKISFSHNDARLNIMHKSINDIEYQFCTPYSMIPLKSGVYYIYRHKKKYEYTTNTPGLTVLFKKGRVVEYFLFYKQNEWE